MSEVILWAGAGQIGLAIARRVAAGKTVVIGDKNIDNAKKMADIMTAAGFTAVPTAMDLGNYDDIIKFINKGLEYGEIKHLISAAGVSPSQASIETILQVDLYGTAVLLAETGKVIKHGGTGVHISSQSGHRMPQLGAEIDELLATTPPEKLLSLDILQPQNIADSLAAYQLAKRCNEKRVMAEAVKWSKRQARINDIAPGIIVTPLALDEFNGVRGNFYKNMFAKCPAGRPGTADEIADIAEFLLNECSSFVTGSTFLADGGATASYFYGELKPNK